MSVIRYVIILSLFSVGLSYPINYTIENDKIVFINNHFILNDANTTIESQNLIFDINRLEFIGNDFEDIQYQIKNIKWTKSNHKIDNFENHELISKQQKFIYRGCPTLYIDIFPYKTDENDNLYYIESADFEFTVQNIEIDGFCNMSNNVTNKDFVFINTPNQVLTETDYIIITSELFNEAAENLKSIHSDLSIDIIFINDIINDYEGLETGYAIKEYLSARIDSGPNLNYLLILGDETIIPPIYNGSTPSDDYYSSSQGLTATPQLSTGRIPVNNNSDAINFISKIQSYIENLENPIDFNQSWRSNITFVSDDENHSDNYPELSHTKNSNSLYNSLKVDLIANTFYGIDYTPIQTSDGLLHSELTDDLIKHINNGISLINYIGHGNHHTLADEKILKMDRDINLINPSDSTKLPIWVVGTCSFGEYDGKDSMAEALLLKNGAISIISTVRGIGETANFTYLEEFFGEITDYVNNIDNDNRLGDIIRESKNGGSQQHLFHLFGDPALPLPFPRSSDNLTESISELSIGEQTLINMNSNNNGYLSVFDSEQNILRIYETGDSINYNIPGEIIYGNSFDDNGQACFITALDASECFGCASIRVYDSDDNLIQNIFNIDITQGLNDGNDIEGPNISFFSDNETQLYNNDIVFLNNTIIVKAQDESGINLMEGLGHSIRYWFNNENNYHFIDSDSFIYTSGCEGEGEGYFNIPLSNLNIGSNTLYVEIWDNFNNRTLESIVLNIETDSFKVYDVYNFPNPFKDETYFTFRLSDFPSDFIISIFDLNGRKIKVIENECDNLFCITKWNGKDLNSKDINNGTYIYHLKLTHNNNNFEGVYKITKLK